MPKCPYCNQEIHIQDFFENTALKTKMGRTRVKFEGFKGETAYRKVAKGYDRVRMWACPLCDIILGFTEYGS